MSPSDSTTSPKRTAARPRAVHDGFSHRIHDKGQVIVVTYHMNEPLGFNSIQRRVLLRALRRKLLVELGALADYAARPDHRWSIAEREISLRLAYTRSKVEQFTVDASGGDIERIIVACQRTIESQLEFTQVLFGQ